MKKAFGIFGAVLVCIPAMAMGGMIISAALHLTVGNGIVLLLLLLLAGAAGVRRAGWANTLGWALSLMIGGSAFAIVGYLVYLGVQ